MKGREGAFGVVLAAILVGVVALAALPLLTGGAPTSAPSTESPAVFASAVAPDGLQLRLVLNATSMPSDGAIFGNMTVVNTSSQNATVITVASQNMTFWDHYNDNCESPYFMAYALFAGRYTAENISSAGMPLTLSPQVATAGCPGGPIPSPMTFLPTASGQGGAGRVIDPARPHDRFRNVVNVTTSTCASTRYFVLGCLYSYPGLVGYWNTTASPPTVVPFSPGIYTILAWDDWNQYVYATFVVRP